VDASNIYDDLSEKYGASIMLTVGLAVSKMHQGLWEEAETHLQQALTKVSFISSSILIFPSLLQDSSNPDSLANMITVSYHLERPAEVINRMIRSLIFSSFN
jgi:hypothetical protein